MAILTEKKSWTRPKRARGFELTATEQANVKKALTALRIRMGGWDELAKAIGATRDAVTKNGNKRGRPTAGMALRAARVAKVSVEEILSGSWPKPGTCPHCGALVSKEET